MINTDVAYATPNAKKIIISLMTSIIIYHVFYELRLVTSDGLNGLENVHLAVLNQLFDTR